MGKRPFTRIVHKSGLKIVLFIFAVLILTILLGILMYFIEGETGGFTTVLLSIYWALTTVLGVGFGDIFPETSVGRMLTLIARIFGYSIIIVPIGIIVSEIYNSLYSALSRKNEKFD